MSIQDIKLALITRGKKLFLCGLFCLFGLFAKADTIDFVHVYLNDSLVLQINQNDFPNAVLHLKGFRAGDSIRIEYWNDTGARGSIYVMRDNSGKLVRQTRYVSNRQSAFSVAEIPKNGCRIMMIAGSSRPEIHLFDIVFD